MNSETESWLNVESKITLICLSSRWNAPVTVIIPFLTMVRRGVLDTTLCDKVYQWLATGRWFFPGTPFFSINKTDCHDITEILLKVVLNTMNLNQLNRFELLLEVKTLHYKVLLIQRQKHCRNKDNLILFEFQLKYTCHCENSLFNYAPARVTRYNIMW